MERNASAPVPPTREPQSGSRAAGGANRPSREEAEAAVRTLLAWTGDDPSREGLLDTPKRVVDSYAEYFWGYDGDPVGELSRTFEDVQGYDDIVMLRDIDFASHCEHHMVPIIGVAHVAYIPDRRIVGISKLARVVDLYAKRLQTQETMTAQIADCIQETLKPKGVAVMMDALHQCMTMRGVHKKGTTTITTRFTGIFSEDKAERERFLQLVNGARVLTGR
ncbi:GTP cyclohydrolase I FolE [Rhodomicrobium lacus]|uniref:GTP cyclohydrolase I FolE n=1 Tax=Rhodomicrobium lacus TaxID=2498452 RepID=UPI000F8C87A1|nr:GTP cyclohydrolase I FolE [Rhodomicrobium lacus]